MIERLGKRGAAAGGLLRVAVLQQLDHDIVELDEAHIEPLCSASQVGNAHRARIDPAHPRLDLLVRQQRIVNALTMEVAVAHHFGAAKDFRIEFERAIHVLNREPEMLHALKPCTKRPIVGFCRRNPLRALCLGRRRDACPRRGQPGQHSGAGGAKRIAAFQVDGIQVSLIAHLGSPCGLLNPPRPVVGPSSGWWRADARFEAGAHAGRQLLRGGSKHDLFDVDLRRLFNGEGDGTRDRWRCHRSRLPGC